MTAMFLQHVCNQTDLQRLICPEGPPAKNSHAVVFLFTSQLVKRSAVTGQSQSGTTNLKLDLLQPVEEFSIVFPRTFAVPCLKHSRGRSVISPPSSRLEANVSVSVRVQSHRNEWRQALCSVSPLQNQN